MRIFARRFPARPDGFRDTALRSVAFDEREVEYDLLVTIPANMGSQAIARSEMGDELNFVPTNPQTLQHAEHENIFVIGDATDCPSSKAGLVAHFEADVLSENIMRRIEGRPLRPAFDGHANCFIESGFGKGILIDFNYDVEPLPGKFPLPGVGPFSLLEEAKMNQWGKMMFCWVYWNLLMGMRFLKNISAAERRLSDSGGPTTSSETELPQVRN
jgi:sulfide:quinone oxidoreductase